MAGMTGKQKQPKQYGCEENGVVQTAIDGDGLDCGASSNPVAAVAAAAARAGAEKERTEFRMAALATIGPSETV